MASITGARGVVSSDPTVDPVPARRGKRRRQHAQRNARQPYMVAVDAIPHGTFDTLADALASARITKSAHPHAAVSITDASTGRITVQIED